MTLPTTSYTVNGRDYTTRLLPARDGLVLMPKIIALLGKEITTMILISPGDQLSALMQDMEVVGSMLHAVSEKAASDNGLLLLHELLRHTTCKQVQLANGMMELSVYENFDTHFAGEYMDLFTVAIHAARASFTKPSPGT